MSFQTGYEAARDREALVISEIDGSSSRCTFAELSARSSQLATWLTAQGVSRGDRVMLNNQLELWECMLACIKGGFVLNPATTMLGTADLQDRTDRANISWVVANAEDTAKFQDVAGDFAVIQVGDEPDAQSTHRTLRYSESYSGPAEYTPTQPTRADESLLLYFTSGTTSKAKLVDHTHTSYPVGDLTTMYWIGLALGDVHLNVAAPGWAKHAWSNIFAPWIAGATVFCYNYSRFDAVGLMDTMEAEGVTSFCAPPTVWRMLIQADLTRMKNPPTKLVAAGEPLNPELIATIERAWNTSVRDGFGQTETTLQIANTPGQKVKPGSMGRPLPDWEVALIDPATDEIAERDEDGYIFYIGRADDVFKASDYRLSPLRAGVRGDRTRRRRRSRRRPLPRPDPPGGAQGLRRPRPRARAHRRGCRVHPPALPRRPGGLQAHPQARVLRAAQNHLRQDPPRRAAQAGKRDPRGRRRTDQRLNRVRRHGLSRPEGLSG